MLTTRIICTFNLLLAQKAYTMRAFKMHVIFGYKLQNSPYILFMQCSPESIFWPLKSVCVDLILMYAIYVYAFSCINFNIDRCQYVQAWCPDDSDSKGTGRGQFINRSTRFICLATVLIDKCVFRLVAIAQSLDTHERTHTHTFSFFRSD